jgi:hypothetical protein
MPAVYFSTIKTGGIMQFRGKVILSRILAVVLLIFVLAIIGFGQHQGHQMPKPAASPTPVATPSPAPSPSGTQTHRHTPGMPMPAASPSPEQKMNMPMPTASPSPNSMGQMEGTHGMASMDMGPLVVMNGDDMGIRVGSSDTNVMSMGAMGVRHRVATIIRTDAHAALDQR